MKKRNNPKVDSMKQRSIIVENDRMDHKRKYSLTESMDDIVDKIKSVIQQSTSKIETAITKYGEIKRIAKLHYDDYKKGEKDFNFHEDAFRHILASAYYTSKIGSGITRNAGYSNEIVGAIRNGIKALDIKEFDSGSSMDIANNEIGIKVGVDNPNESLKFYEDKVKNIVDSGNFYVEDGKTFYKDIEKK